MILYIITIYTLGYAELTVLRIVIIYTFGNGELMILHSRFMCTGGWAYFIYVSLVMLKF
jgi:hypothetical protein